MPDAPIPCDGTSNAPTFQLIGLVDYLAYWV